jgi:hypothetical protein
MDESMVRVNWVQPGSVRFQCQGEYYFHVLPNPIQVCPTETDTLYDAAPDLIDIEWNLNEDHRVDT